MKVVLPDGVQHEKDRSRLPKRAMLLGLIGMIALVALGLGRLTPRPVEATHKTTTTTTPSLETPTAATSSEWFRVPHDETVFGGEKTQSMRSLTAGGPGYVAVGADGILGSVAAVWTSADGINWFRVPHDESVFGGAVMRSVTTGGPGLVAVGEGSWEYEGLGDAAVWTSADGIDWFRVPHDESVFGGAVMWSVTTGGPGLVAVGMGDRHDFPDENEEEDGVDAVVWTSVDGITWSRVLHDESVFGGKDNEAMYAVTVGGPGLVAVGRDGGHESGVFSGPLGYAKGIDAAVWTSVDGINWTRVPHDEAVFGGSGDPVMLDVTAGGPGLVAVGDDGPWGAVVWTSIDGVTWSKVRPDWTLYGAGMNAVAAGGPGLIAVGTGGLSPVWTSTDGVTWSRVPDDDGFKYTDMTDLIVGGPGLISVGDAQTLSPYDVDAAVWISEN